MILDKFKSYIETKAKYYSQKGLEYSDVYNQCYLCIYDLCPACKTTDELKVKVDHELRNYYRQELKERHFNYGTNPTNINL
jgi:hypothetical protein